MASDDPAFLFYPGDYLKDTQCLSEPAQVAYDRIMCEHMRNICISQERLNFFTKRLTDDQKLEVMSVLERSRDGFQIGWVAKSIVKRQLYSNSRRKNREGKGKNISKSYVPHMENENENAIENGINEIGVKNEFSISIKAKYAGERPRRIYDLTEYFRGTDQLSQVLAAGWAGKIKTFIKDNPAKVFDDDNHLYNSLKLYTPEKNGRAVAFDLSKK